MRVLHRNVCAPRKFILPKLARGNRGKVLRLGCVQNGAILRTMWYNIIENTAKFCHNCGSQVTGKRKIYITFVFRFSLRGKVSAYM